MSNSASTALVIGAGFGGLAAAMRLGALGYRVTVLDRLDEPGGRGTSITQNGHRFDLGPATIRTPDALRDLWAACGRNFDDDIDMRPLDPLYEIRWPDGARFSARQSIPAMRAEVARFAPEDLKGFDKFLSDSESCYRFGYQHIGRRPMNSISDVVRALPKLAKHRADRSVYAHAASHVRDERLRMALSFHPLFIGGDPFRVSSLYAFVGHLEKAQGVHYAIGGMAQIAKAMACVIEDQGGEFMFGVKADEAIFANGRARGVRLTDGRELRADIVVSNADASQTHERLMRNGPRRARRYSARNRSKVVSSLFVWHFGTVDTRTKWPEVGHQTILNGPRYQGFVRDVFRNGTLPQDLSLYVHRPSATDPTVAPVGGDTFYALSPVPHLDHAPAIEWNDMREPYRQRVSDMLEDHLLPGLGAHLSASEVFTPLDFRDRYLNANGAGYGASTWFRPHKAAEPAPGLFLVGTAANPGAGMPGVLSSAEVLAKLVPPCRAPRNSDALAAE